MSTFVAGKDGCGFAIRQESLIDRVTMRPHPQRKGGLIPDVAVPIRVGSGTRTQDVSVSVALDDFERCLPYPTGAASLVFEHDDPLAKDEAEFGSEQPDRGVQRMFEETCRFLPEVECHVGQG